MYVTRRPPSSTRTGTLFPYTTPFRSLFRARHSGPCRTPLGFARDQAIRDALKFTHRLNAGRSVEELAALHNSADPALNRHPVERRIARRRRHFVRVHLPWRIRIDEDDVGRRDRGKIARLNAQEDRKSVG